MSFIQPNFSKILFGFSEGYSSKDPLFQVIEQFFKALDELEKAGRVLMDLSKAYDCIPYDLLLENVSYMVSV